MGDTLFRFTVGSFNCLAIQDGDDWDRNVLLINTGQHHVLIETGNGDATSLPGLLLDRLRTAGISPLEIDVVILSHADVDHIAGAVNAGGQLTFPQARYILSRPEWAYWSANPVRLQPSTLINEELHQLSNTVPGIRLSQLRDKLELIDFTTEIVPGIRAIAAPGHTPGHMAIAISAGDEQVCFIGDLAYNPDDIGNPEWHAFVDVDPSQAAATRNRLFEQAARDRTLLMAYHFPFPGLGYIGQHEQGWRWLPLDTKG